MNLELMRPVVSFLLLQGSFLAGCVWYGRRENGVVVAAFWGGLALVLGLAGLGYVGVWWLMGPIR